MIVLHDLNNKKRYTECDLLEYELQDMLIKNWDNLFSDYFFISKEFILSGDVTINGYSLATRDGLGVWEMDQLSIMADTDAEFLLMEVPMNY